MKVEPDEEAYIGYPQGLGEGDSPDYAGTGECSHMPWGETGMGEAGSLGGSLFTLESCVAPAVPLRSMGAQHDVLAHSHACGISPGQGWTVGCCLAFR